jgi:hypothetical protein
LLIKLVIAATCNSPAAAFDAARTLHAADVMLRHGYSLAVRRRAARSNSQPVATGCALSCRSWLAAHQEGHFNQTRRRSSEDNDRSYRRHTPPTWRTTPGRTSQLMRLTPSDTGGPRRLEQKLLATFFFRVQNASSQEIRRRQACARTLSWQYFRLFQQNRPGAEVPWVSESA